MRPILIVEDEPAIADLIEMTLEPLGQPLIKAHTDYRLSGGGEQIMAQRRIVLRDVQCDLHRLNRLRAGGIFRILPPATVKTIGHETGVSTSEVVLVDRGLVEAPLRHGHRAGRGAGCPLPGQPRQFPRG